MIKTGIGLFYLVLAAWLVFAACSPRAVPSGGVDEYGCPELPPDTFTSAGVDVSSSIDAFQNLLKGKVDVKSDPRVLSLASQAARDSLSRDKIRCLAMRRDKYTPAQAMHLDDRTAFLSTNPNPDQYLNWRQMNPFPETADEQVKLLEREVDKIRQQATKSDQELHALRERTKERRLTSSKRTGFTEALIKGERGEIEVSFLSGNSESEHFAHDLAGALYDSGWKVRMSSITSIGRTQVGLRVVVRDRQMPNAQSLLSALLQIDQRIEVKENPKADRPIRLIVGYKP